MEKINPNNFLVIPFHLFLKSYDKITSDKYQLQIGASRYCKQITLPKKALDLYLLFLEPTSPKQAAKALKVPLNSVIQFCEKFIKSQLLSIEKPIPNNFLRYDRNLQFYNLIGLNALEVQSKFSTLSIAVLGIGGLGNWISLSLVGLGFKKIKLLDYDTIELTNLNRQILFKEYQIGEKKAKIAQAELQDRNKQTEVEAVDFKITNSQNEYENNVLLLMKELKNIDFLVVSADKPPRLIQSIVSKACLNTKTPHIFTGYSDKFGVVGPLVIPKKTACFDCLLDIRNPRLRRYFQELEKQPKEIQSLSDRYRAPSFTGINSLVASIATFEIFKYLSGFREFSTKGARLVIDPLSWKIEVIHLKKSPVCPLCSNE